MDYQRKKTLVERYVNAYNNFDIQGMVKTLHPDIIFRNASNGQADLSLEGREAFEEQAEFSAALFSEREQEIINWQEQNEKLIIHIEYRSVLARDLPNGTARGTEICLRGNSEFTFADNYIKTIVDIY